MRPLIKKLFPKSTRRERRRLEVGVIILSAVLIASVLFLVVICRRLIAHRHGAH